jgi:group I intron endonuclease
MAAIYKITNTKDGRVYIGSAIKPIDRWSVHRSRLNSGTHHSMRMQRAWLRDGADVFEFSIIEEIEPSAMLAREQFWMDHFRSFGEGYNMTLVAGSSLGLKRSPETLQKMSIARTGVKLPPHRQETKEKIRQAHLGKPKGPMSDTHKAAIAAGQIGKLMSAAVRDKISRAHRGRAKGPMSDAHKENIRQAQLRRGPRSEAHCKNLSTALAAAHRRKPKWRERLP